MNGILSQRKWERKIPGSFCKEPNPEVAWLAHGTERQPAHLKFNGKTTGRKLERQMGVRLYRVTGHVKDLVHIPEQLQTTKAF